MRNYFKEIMLKICGAETEQTPLNCITLSFSSKKLNEDFLIHHAKQSMKLVRWSILLSVVLFLLFGILDGFVVPGKADQILNVRIVVSFLLFSIFLFLFNKWALKYFQLLMSMVIAVGVTGIIALIIISESDGGYLFYAGLILAIIYAHSLLRLRFIYAAATTWTAIIIYLITLYSFNSTPEIIAINNSFFLITANLLGMFASYGIEYYMRTDYWKTIMLKEKTALLESEFLHKSKELENVRQIQLSMLPGEAPYHPDIEISFLMKTASEIGGDYYDFHLSKDNTLTVAIGDATGHGARAGAMVTAMKILFANYSSHLPLTDFMKKADAALRLLNLPRLYMSFAIGRFKKNEFEITGVGMPPLLIYKKALNIIEKIPLKGLPLGSYTQFPFYKNKISLAEGDAIILMTDGLPELFNEKKEMIGYERLEYIFGKSVKNSTQKIIENFISYGDSWVGNCSQGDDITLLIMKVKEKIESELIKSEGNSEAGWELYQSDNHKKFDAINSN
jgi:hypothetical protein